LCCFCFQWVLFLHLQNFRAREKGLHLLSVSKAKMSVDTTAIAGEVKNVYPAPVLKDQLIALKLVAYVIASQEITRALVTPGDLTSVVSIQIAFQLVPLGTPQAPVFLGAKTIVQRTGRMVVDLIPIPQVRIALISDLWTYANRSKNRRLTSPVLHY